MRPRFAYLLDTNAASEPARLAPDPGFMAWLQDHQHEVALPVFVLFEQRKGIEAVPDASLKRRVLESAFRRLVRDFSEAILPFAEADAWAAGEHYHALISDFGRGVVDQVGLVDFFIAAQARAHHLRVVTRNTAHFPHCGELVNPWLEHPAP